MITYFLHRPYIILLKITWYLLIMQVVGMRGKCSTWKFQYERKIWDFLYNSDGQYKMARCTASPKNPGAINLFIVLHALAHAHHHLKLSDLCNMYIDFRQNTRYANPSYRSSKLKAKLEKFNGDKLSFCDLGRFNTYLVYNSNISMDFAIRQAHTIGSQATLTDSATSFHGEINNTWKSAPELKRPTTVNYLASMDGNVPPKLLKFLTVLVTGRPVCSKRMEILIHSFGQDTSRATTSGA